MLSKGENTLNKLKPDFIGFSRPRRGNYFAEVMQDHEDSVIIPLRCFVQQAGKGMKLTFIEFLYRSWVPYLAPMWMIFNYISDNTEKQVS